jgi:hypothetical protein
VQIGNAGLPHDAGVDDLGSGTAGAVEYAADRGQDAGPVDLGAEEAGERHSCSFAAERGEYGERSPIADMLAF